MRFSGAVFLWISFTLTGIMISSLLKKREDVIGQTVVFLSTLIVEIEFSRSSVPSIICKLSKEKALNNLIFLDECCNSLNDGADFPFAWANGLNSTAQLYKRDEKDKLLQLGSFLGTSDATGQINTIKMYLAFFKEYHDGTKTELKKYGNTASMLGILMGAAVFILLS